MGGLYLGGELVTPVIEKKVEVAKTKFGATVDSFLGEVVDGKYIRPESEEVVTFSGLTSVANQGFRYSFSGYSGKFSFPDVIEVGEYSFFHTWDAHTGYLSVSFDKLEEINSAYCFEEAFAYDSTAGGNPNSDFFFPSLKKINANRAFRATFPSGNYKNFDKTFPVLEYVSGEYAFYSFMNGSLSSVSASNLNTIVGTSTSNHPPFEIGYTGSGIVCGLFLPRATNVSGYIIKPYSGRTCNLHFAIANQAAIEACDGYDYKFGATEIYFDLVLGITVNGTLYSRKLCCGDKSPYGTYSEYYTSWEDMSGNVVYTYSGSYYYDNGYEEPAVGTVVYSDLGITQVGTVEGVA